MRSLRRRRSIAGVTRLLLGVSAVVALVVVALGPLTWLVAGGSVRRLHGLDQANALNALRQTMLTAVGGAGALIALGFTARTYYLSRRGQVTDRFNKAIGQLASDKLEERLGGIHALEHVMTESPADHMAVVGVLSAFVRAHTLVPPKRRRFTEMLRQPNSKDRDRPPAGAEPAADIDAAMIVLARRPDRDEPNRPDLRRASLVGLSLRIYDFAAPPRLTGMFLTWVDLRSADLRGADLSGTVANFADFRWACLINANLTRTALSDAKFRGASMGGADLTGALLTNSDLRRVNGLTARQLSSAVIDRGTLLPGELADDPWVQKRLADCLAMGGAPGPRGCPPPTPRPTSA